MRMATPPASFPNCWGESSGISGTRRALFRGSVLRTPTAGLWPERSTCSRGLPTPRPARRCWISATRRLSWRGDSSGCSRIATSTACWICETVESAWSGTGRTGPTSSSSCMRSTSPSRRCTSTPLPISATPSSPTTWPPACSSIPGFAAIPRSFRVRSFFLPPRGASPPPRAGTRNCSTRSIPVWRSSKPIRTPTTTTFCRAGSRSRRAVAFRGGCGPRRWWSCWCWWSSARSS